MGRSEPFWTLPNTLTWLQNETKNVFFFFFLCFVLQVQHRAGVPAQEAGPGSPQGAAGVRLRHHHPRHQQPAARRRDHLHHLGNSPGIPRPSGHTLRVSLNHPAAAVVFSSFASHPHSCRADACVILDRLAPRFIIPRVNL